METGLSCGGLLGPLEAGLFLRTKQIPLDLSGPDPSEAQGAPNQIPQKSSHLVAVLSKYPTLFIFLSARISCNFPNKAPKHCR